MGIGMGSSRQKHEEEVAELERLGWVSGLSTQQQIMAEAWQIKQEALLSFYEDTLKTLAADKASHEAYL